MPLRYLKNIDIFLTAQTDEELVRLVRRLEDFLIAIRDHNGLRIQSIGFYTSTSSLPVGSVDAISTIIRT